MFSAFNEIFLMLLPFRGELVYRFVYFVETRFTFTAIKFFFFHLHNLLCFAHLLSQY